MIESGRFYFKFLKEPHNFFWIESFDFLKFWVFQHKPLENKKQKQHGQI